VTLSLRYRPVAGVHHPRHVEVEVGGRAPTAAQTGPLADRQHLEGLIGQNHHRIGEAAMVNANFVVPNGLQRDRFLAVAAEKSTRSCCMTYFAPLSTLMAKSAETVALSPSCR
jgi:hypothetical protein